MVDSEEFFCRRSHSLICSLALLQKGSSFRGRQLTSYIAAMPCISLFILLLSEVQGMTSTPKPTLSTPLPTTTAELEEEVLTNDMAVGNSGRLDDILASVRRLPGEIEKLIEKVKATNKRAIAKLFAAIADNRKQLSVIAKMLGKPIPSRQELDSCPSPWQKFKGLCLLFVKDKRKWLEARQFCADKAGHLTWIQSRAEHRKINAFVRQQKHFDFVFYHVGLFRERRGSPLRWDGGSIGSYRGKSSNISPSSMTCISEVLSETIIGVVSSPKLPFVCRK